MYRHAVKRILDLLGALVGLVLLWPVMLLIAVAVKVDSPGEVLFRQERLGRGRRCFEMLKFRTMRVGSEHQGSGVYSDDHDDRVTRVGRLLRRTSLDELPQLWNILRGDMSFVGPRPPLTYHPWPADGYPPESLAMFSIRPGLTGWAQIHGRRAIPWEERIRLNVWYAAHLSFLLDVRILLATVGRVLVGQDNQNLGATAPSTPPCPSQQPSECVDVPEQMPETMP